MGKGGGGGWFGAGIQGNVYGGGSILDESEDKNWCIYASQIPDTNFY